MVKLRPRHISERLHVSRRMPKVRDVVEVFWEDRGLAFRGRLAKRLRAKDNVFLVSYDDGDEAWHDLDEHYWRPAGTQDWVEPSMFEVENPSTNVGEVQTWRNKSRRKQLASEPLIPTLMNRNSSPSLEKRDSRHCSQPSQRLPRKLSKASLSNTNDEWLPVKSGAGNSPVSPKSEVSTQLSSCKNSAEETTGYNKSTPTISADTHCKPFAVNADDFVQAILSQVTTATTNSVDSNDEMVPPRKRKSFFLP